MKERKAINYVTGEYIGRWIVTICGLLIVLTTISIIVFICGKGIQSFTHSNISVVQMFTSLNWSPNDPQNKSYGALIFIVGSTLVSIGAAIISSPIAIALAIFNNYIAPKFGSSFLKPVLELLVGVPLCSLWFLRGHCSCPLVKSTNGRGRI